MHDHGESTLYGIAPEHTAGVIALMLLPVAIWLALRVLRTAAYADRPMAVRLYNRYGDASTVTRTAALSRA